MTVGPATTEAPPPISYRALLKVRGYPELLAAQAVSRVGDSVHYIALVALIFSLTGSGLAVSGAVVFGALPVLLFGARTRPACTSARTCSGGSDRPVTAHP